MQPRQEDECIRCIMTNLHARYRQILSATLTSTSCTCDNDQHVEPTSWILSGQPTTQCSTGLIPPAGAISACPCQFSIILNPDWSVGFYAGTTCCQTPYPTFGATMSGTTYKTCQNLNRHSKNGPICACYFIWNMGVEIRLTVAVHLRQAVWEVLAITRATVIDRTVSPPGSL